MPFKKRIEHNNVECFLECTGNGLRLDNGNGFRNKKSVDYPLYKRDFSPECGKRLTYHKQCNGQWFIHYKEEAFLPDKDVKGDAERHGDGCKSLNMSINTYRGLNT